MKKGKIIAYSVLGIGVSAVVYFLVKKMNSKKKALPDLKANTTTQTSDGTSVVAPPPKEFSSKVVSVGKNVRAGIESLRYQSGNDRTLGTKMEKLVTTLGGLTTEEKKEMTDWYNSRGFNSFGNLQGALEKLLSPLWFDRAQRTLWNINWK
tara:strand:+ start:15430 stop:15882 length:453 start_codon:yes stop_codon:yes gene_type:complete